MSERKKQKHQHCERSGSGLFRSSRLIGTIEFIERTIIENTEQESEEKRGNDSTEKQKEEHKEKTEETSVIIAGHQNSVHQ